MRLFKRKCYECDGYGWVTAFDVYELQESLPGNTLVADIEQVGKELYWHQLIDLTTSALPADTVAVICPQCDGWGKE